MSTPRTKPAPRGYNGSWGDAFLGAAVGALVLTAGLGWRDFFLAMFQEVRARLRARLGGESGAFWLHLLLLFVYAVALSTLGVLMAQARGRAQLRSDRRRAERDREANAQLLQR